MFINILADKHKHYIIAKINNADGIFLNQGRKFKSFVGRAGTKNSKYKKRSNMMIDRDSIVLLGILMRALVKG
jgi:hypothetical protein